MSLCERVMEMSDSLADLLLAADACGATDPGKSLRLLQSAVDAAQAAKFCNESARAILAAAKADPAVRAPERHPDALRALNDNHPTTPTEPGPIVA